MFHASIMTGIALLNLAFGNVLVGSLCLAAACGAFAFAPVGDDE